MVVSSIIHDAYIMTTVLQSTSKSIEPIDEIMEFQRSIQLFNSWIKKKIVETYSE